MNTPIQTTKFLLSILFGTLLVFTLNGCSDDKADSKAASANKSVFDHAHDDSVTDMVKHQFEHQFADQCLARELKNSQNKSEDKKRYEKDCMCIARYLLKDLTAVDAEKFLKENQSTHALRIRFDAAAYFCLQQKAQPQPPKLFGKS